LESIKLRMCSMSRVRGVAGRTNDWGEMAKGCERQEWKVLVTYCAIEGKVVTQRLSSYKRQDSRSLQAQSSLRLVDEFMKVHSKFREIPSLDVENGPPAVRTNATVDTLHIALHGAIDSAIASRANMCHAVLCQIMQYTTAAHDSQCRTPTGIEINTF
jgi:hypothetical protein